MFQDANECPIPIESRVGPAPPDNSDSDPHHYRGCPAEADRCIKDMMSQAIRTHVLSAIWTHIMMVQQPCILDIREELPNRIFWKLVDKQELESHDTV